MRWNPPSELSPREARLCDRLAKHRRFFRFLRLHRHRLFDEAFQAELVALYSDQPRGNPPLPPALLAAVILLQAYADVSDEDAVQLAETDARWQLVLDCLGAEDAPFKKTALVDFRARLVRADAHVALLRRTVDLAKETRDFGFKQAAALRVAVDSVPRAGAGRVEDTLNLVGRALRMLVGATAVMLALEPAQVIAQVPLPVLEAPSIKAGLDRDWDAPGATDAALTDLCREVEALRGWLAARTPEGMCTRAVAEADARVTRLRDQDAERNGTGGWRIRQEVAPDRQISVSDPAMRHGRKNESVRIDGYKEYLATDLDTGLTLGAGVLPANVAEACGADKLRASVEAHGPVGELHVDRAFLSSGWATAVAARDVSAIVGRAPRVANGGLYPKTAFAIDLAAQTVTCPTGQRAAIRSGHARFALPVCGACAQRAQCQKPGAVEGRTISIGPNERLLQHLATASRTAAGRARLRQRVAVEHSLSHQVRRRGRRARYRGTAKNDFDACRIAAVTNLMVIDRRVRAAEAVRASACVNVN